VDEESFACGERIIVRKVEQKGSYYRGGQTLQQLLREKNVERRTREKRETDAGKKKFEIHWCSPEAKGGEGLHEEN